MFTKQSGRIEQSLIEGGQSPLAANDTMHALAHCAAPLVHRGPVSFDYTPPDYRFVTPPKRKYRFPQMDSPESRRKPPKREEKKDERERQRDQPEETEPVAPRSRFQPTRRDGGWDNITSIAEGPYIAVGVAGPTTAIVGLRGYGPANSVAVFGDNRLMGRNLNIRSQRPDLLGVQSSPGMLQYMLQPKGEEVEVITDIKVDDSQIIFTRKSGFLLGSKDADDLIVDLKRITYLTNAVMGESSIDFQRRDTYVLAGDDRDADVVSLPLTDCADITA
jgi:hypothetical protein